MATERLLIKTSKGVQALAEGVIGLDERHVRVLGLLDGTRQIVSLAETAGYPEADVQSILKKLILIGYARSVGSSGPHLESGLDTDGARAFGSAEARGPETFGSLDDDNSFLDIDVAALRSAAKSREQGISNPLSLGSTEDVWKQTQDLAQQMMADRLAREQAQRLAAEQALEDARIREEQARQRELALEQARQDAEEALARSREEATRRADAEREAESLRQKALEQEQARQRRMGVYRRRLRWGSACATLAAAVLWIWGATSSASLAPAKCSGLLSAWSQIPSTASSCQTSFFPSPRFEAKGISMGRAHVESAEGSLALLPLLLGKAEPLSLSLHGLSIDSNTVATLIRTPHKGRLGVVRDIDIDGARLDVGNLLLDGLKGTATLDSQGQLDRLTLVDDEHLARISLANEKGAVKFSIQARFADRATAPIQSALDVSVYGTLERDRLVVEDGSVGFKNGQASFSGEASWTAQRWVGQGKVDMHSVGLSDIAPWLFNAGSADLTGQFSFDGPDAARSLSGATLDVSGPGRNLSLKMDLPETLGAGANMGFSAFPQGAIRMRFAQKNHSFSMPSLASGPLRAKVDVSLSAQGKVSGSALASLPERGMSTESALSGDAGRIELSSKGH